MAIFWSCGDEEEVLNFKANLADHTDLPLVSRSVIVNRQISARLRRDDGRDRESVEVLREP